MKTLKSDRNQLSGCRFCALLSQCFTNVTLMSMLIDLIINSEPVGIQFIPGLVINRSQYWNFSVKSVVYLRACTPTTDWHKGPQPSPPASTESPPPAVSVPDTPNTLCPAWVSICGEMDLCTITQVNYKPLQFELTCDSSVKNLWNWE